MKREKLEAKLYKSCGGEVQQKPYLMLSKAFKNSIVYATCRGKWKEIATSRNPAETITQWDKLGGSHKQCGTKRIYLISGTLLTNPLVALGLTTTAPYGGKRQDLRI